MAKKHTALSPSNSDRWLHCPGSVALCAQMPKPPQSPHALEGEVAHFMLERCLEDQTQVPADWVGMEVKGVPVTEEMAEAVSFAREQVQLDLQKGGELLIEQKVEILPGISGTLDIAIVRPYDTLIVKDFKYGKGVVVSALENSQLMLYAAPLAEKYEVRNIQFGIIQPRTEGMLSNWECDDEYLRTFMEEVKRKIKLTQEKNAITSPGSWCRWCYAKAICPSLRKDISASLPDIQHKDLIFPDVKGLSVDNMKKVLDCRDRFDAWMDSVFAFAKEYIESGGEIEGWELVKKRAHRKWKNEAVAMDAFSDLGEKAYKVTLLSPAQLEKIVGKEKVAELTEIPDTGTTLKQTGEKK